VHRGSISATALRAAGRLACLGTRLLLLFPAIFVFPAGSPGRLVGGGEVVPGHQRVGVGLARRPLAVGEGGLVVVMSRAMLGMPQAMRWG